MQPKVKYRQPPLLFRNAGQRKFENASTAVGAQFSRPMLARGAAYGDYDRDGDLDVLFTENHGPAWLYRNDGGNANNFISIRTRGVKSNRDGIGAVVRVTSADRHAVEHGPQRLQLLLAERPGADVRPRRRTRRWRRSRSSGRAGRRTGSPASRRISTSSSKRERASSLPKGRGPDRAEPEAYGSGASRVHYLLDRNHTNARGRSMPSIDTKGRRDFLSSLGVASATVLAPGVLHASAGHGVVTQVPGGSASQAAGEYLLAAGLTYLNTAALGPTPRSVLNRTLEAWYQLESNPVLMAYADGPVHVATDRVREQAASFLGCSTDELLITRSTTDAMNSLTQGMRLRPGDRVLTTDHEHEGGEAGWHYIGSPAGCDGGRRQPAAHGSRPDRALSGAWRPPSRRTPASSA